MAHILAVSSHVAYGHVGLSAAVPVLQALGHEVLAVPTAVQSSHNGYPIVGGGPLSPAHLNSILAALADNGWLDTADAVLSGYLPHAEHVAVLAAHLSTLRARRPPPLVMCDPVIGDDPRGLYVPAPTAAAIRDQLLPLADILTPNRFELGWLARSDVADVRSAAAAAHRLGRPAVLATSVPAGDGRLANVLVHADRCLVTTTARHREVPSGTGDLLASLVLGHRLAGRGLADAMAHATAAVETAIAASLGTGELRLLEALGPAMAALPAPIEELD